MTLSERLKNINIPVIVEEPPKKSETPELTKLCSDLSMEISDKIASMPVWFEYSSEEQRKLIADFVDAKLSNTDLKVFITLEEKEQICSKILQSIHGFGPLDFYISQDNVDKIFVTFDKVQVELDNNVICTDIAIDGELFESLLNRLVNISGKVSPVITFRLNDLVITILRKPVCETTLILKKIPMINYDFEYFEKNEVLNEDISNFLRQILNDKKRIIISAPNQCGKTTLLNSFINETVQDSRMLLFEEANIINSNHCGLMRFDIDGLTQKERRDLVKSVFYYAADYVFLDVNNGQFNIDITELLTNNAQGFISTICANSILEAFELYTSTFASCLNCTQKFAKMRFAKDIDYIIQLQKYEDCLKIASIIYVSANKSGNPILTEILTYKSGAYKYNFEKTERQIIPAAMTKGTKNTATEITNSEKNGKQVTFSERIND
jgi:Flp pilus assembly CpaF family ATPase